MDNKVNELESLRPDCLSGKAILNKSIDIAQTKRKLSVSKCFVLASLAGAFIAFGSLFFLTFTADPTLSFGPKKIGGGLCFCLGLSLVVLCGAELFTGNVLMVIALLSKKIKAVSVLKNWAVVLLGNLVGSLLIAFLVCGANIPNIDVGGTTIGDNMVSIATSKIGLDWSVIFLRAILCNILVCLAVYISYASRTVVDKVVGIFLPIAGFVTCGFEHCIANMFFLPMGMLCDASQVSFSGILWNLSASIPGNIVGGAIFVGAPYWYVYREG